MAETSLPWGGQVTGDCGPYDEQEWAQMMRDILSLDSKIHGVLNSYGSQLAPSQPSGTTVRIASGAAMVDGTFYRNTANIDFNVSAIGYYMIVLRKSWATQTVRLVMLGPNPSTVPTLTRSAGVTWEIPICQVQNSASWGVTPTDVRAFTATEFPSIVRFDSAVPYNWMPPGEGASVQFYPPKRPYSILASYASTFTGISKISDYLIQINTNGVAFAYPPVVFTQIVNQSETTYPLVPTVLNVDYNRITVKITRAVTFAGTITFNFNILAVGALNAIGG